MELSLVEVGKRFKEIRLSRGYSREIASKDIVSTSFLNKFERGETNISFIKMVALLKRLNISTSEFLQPLDPDSNVSYTVFLKRLMEIYTHNDARTLKKMLSEIQNQTTIKNSKLDTVKQATLISLISDLDPSFSIDISLEKEIRYYFMTIDDWTGFQISAFSNCLTVLTTTSIRLIIKELISKFRDLKNINNNDDTFLGTLINAAEILINRGELDDARKIIGLLDDFNISHLKLLLRFKKTFLYNLLFLDSAKAVKKNNLMFQTLRDIGSGQLASSYEDYQEKFYHSA
ncbi:helix-turn-helix domain-containing protein [Oenococcus sp.]|uniref:helix-turn-helix domain-containing protein n=1 Tax=Oenococcus sp. TaxID=1979414 RepID=UPI0039E98682